MYTKEQEQFIIDNYPIYGGRYCSDYLDKSLEAINAKAIRLNLKAGRERHHTIQKVSISQFNKIESKEVAYFLGFFWADGYIRNYTSKNITHWRICLEIQSEDADDILPIMSQLGKWAIVKRKRKESWKETTSFVTNNKDLYQFLEENDYRHKSTVEPTKILEKIPTNLHPYFWKGFFDGDCHISKKLYKNVTHCVFEISGPIKYEWKVFISKLTDLSITKFNCYIFKNKNKKHSSSCIKIYGKEICKLETLFVNYGLKRKTQSFIEIVKNYKGK